MIREANQLGLVISAGVVRHAGPMRQVTRCTGWPTLSEATTWLLRRELLVHVPRVALFWLEHEDRVEATARLVGWLRETYPAVWRVVVAYQLEGDIELVLRSAGAQIYLPASDSVCDLVERSILPLIRGDPLPEGREADAPAGRRGRRGVWHDTRVPRGQFRRDLHPP